MEKFECKLEEQPELQTLSVRTRGKAEDIPALCGQFYGAIAGYMQEVGAAPVGAPFVVYYNQDMQDLDLEIGFPVAGVLEGKDQIQASVIAAGRSASIIHQGPYNQVESSYNRLLEWMEQENVQPLGHACEFYLNDPSTTPADQLLTKIIFPLA